MDGSEGEEAPNPNPDENFLVIRDDYFVHHESPVFPPILHEDLPVLTVENHIPSSDESESSESSDSSDSSTPESSDMRLRAVVVEAIMRGCEVVKAKVVSGIVGFGCYGVRLRSIFGATAMAGLLIVLLFLLKMKMKVWLPWRPRGLAVRRDKEEPLVLLLKHKDEKINQLLLQIAQMNETLSARRKVPVVRIK
ncbi:hypothetical protein IC582_021245 [Cucumis melo]|uniref:Uncharacterized protein LOC103503357 n=2 Tax=Cucumis melo TaxID=3656 RepID=A0A1S3CPJ3_CUCME|nr:uncharacterized protein LOC103503357 [Cucumis melo]KAA0038912.1 uncharacterized protein E6C27_scaffold1170G00800 [Cucumis melo var. makuwa]TYK04662.1 uncharacterized protein E5676_scaffold1133G00150 [Cucumis melo var. makuwa]